MVRFNPNRQFKATGKVKRSTFNQPHIKAPRRPKGMKGM